MTTTPERPAPAPDLLAEADVRTAARTLLRQPLLHADRDAEELARVRRYRDELVRLFGDGLGYRLVVEPGLARLYKTGLPPDSGRGLRRPNGASFTPRRYMLLALTLAALTQGRRQVMVDELVAGVRSAAVDADVDIDLDGIADRRALHSALVTLVDLGVLSERDGDLEHWAERRTESLLDVHRDRLAVLIAAPLSTCTTPEQVLAVTSVPSSAGGARVAIRRVIAEQTVMSVDDLTDEQRNWWRRNREREREWFRRWLGLDLELRAEGAVAVDPSGDLTDIAFPAPGSAKHFALLLLSALVDHVRAESEGADGVTWARITASSAREIGDRVFARWRRGLRKAHQESPDAVFDEALTILASVGLVRHADGAVLVHAAGARYAPRPELVTSTGPSGERSLFDQEET